MVLLTDKIQKRLTIQTQDIAADTTAIRSMDWERDRFDIEFGLQNGTTYNSFIIRGDKLALVDTSHEKFRQLYLDTLKGLSRPNALSKSESSDFICSIAFALVSNCPKSVPASSHC